MAKNVKQFWYQTGIKPKENEEMIMTIKKLSKQAGNVFDTSSGCEHPTDPISDPSSQSICAKSDIDNRHALRDPVGSTYTQTYSTWKR